MEKSCKTCIHEDSTNYERCRSCFRLGNYDRWEPKENIEKNCKNCRGTELVQTKKIFGKTFYNYPLCWGCEDNSNWQPKETKTERLNNYMDNIFQRFHRQYDKGLQKYGKPLDEHVASIEQRLNHLAEELTDALCYIEWIKEGLSKIEGGNKVD